MFLRRLMIGGLIAICTLFFLACDSEPKEDFAQKILGHWEVTEAYRNKKLTTTLDSAYFEFFPEGNAILNLDGNNQKATYSISEGNVNIEGTSMDGAFAIQKIQNDSMALTTTKSYSGIPFDFIFYLVRATDK